MGLHEAILAYSPENGKPPTLQWAVSLLRKILAWRLAFLARSGTAAGVSIFLVVLLGTLLAALSAWTVGEKHESADDSEIFQERSHLHLAVISAPARVIHEGSESGEDDEHPGRLALFIVEHEHEAATEFEDDGDDESDGRQRHRKTDIAKTRSDKTDHILEIQEEPETADDKEK